MINIASFPPFLIDFSGVELYWLVSHFYCAFWGKLCAVRSVGRSSALYLSSGIASLYLIIKSVIFGDFSLH